ncbi:MAG TPA: glucose transporter [Firmicutes bacterium]|nr:glucose transporter [Bacillota bacterium]
MHSRRDELLAILVILPTIVLLGVFVYGFIGQSVRASMTDWGQQAALSLKPELHYVGLGNYRGLFAGFLGMRFRQDLTNMVFFTALFVAVALALGLGLATLIDHLVWGEAFFRTVFLFPMSLSFVVTGTIWRWLLQPRGGVNMLPSLVGLPAGQFLWLSSRDQCLVFDWAILPHYLLWAPAIALAVLAWFGRRRAGQRGQRAAGRSGLRTAVRDWRWQAAAAAALAALAASGVSRRWTILEFTETHGFNLAVWGVVIAAVWQQSGYTMALYLAGLRTIPDELREAARVDGASRLQIYRYIELPMLTPITVSAVVILGHIALKIFDLIFAMAGPDHAPTSVPAISMFLKTFRGNEFAVGSSIGVVLLMLVSLLIIPYVSTSYGRGGDR